MTNNPEAAVILDRVSFSYDRGMIIDGADLLVRTGDFLGIIGPNGGGKTTLLRLMLGLLAPDSGCITILGGTPVKQRKNVGYIPQETGLNKGFPVTVREVILTGLAGSLGIGKGYRKKDQEKADELVELLGLIEIQKQPIGQISGGQRQKTLLARAMIAKPAMLLLDEPTSSVDAKGEDEIYRYLLEINRKGITIVLVTHNTGTLSQYVKSVACVNRKVFFHPDGKLEPDTVRKTFGCGIDLIAHGVPHRVFHEHDEAHHHD